MNRILCYLKIDVLVWVALIQVSIAFGFLRPLGIDVALNQFGITLVLLSSICIAAAGQLIMALYSNRIQPKTTKKEENSIFNTFLITTIVGIAIGFYLSNIIQRPIFITIFIIISALFYLYATYLKEILIVKNVLIAFSIGMVILNMGIFDLLPAITAQNRSALQTVFSILLDYGLLLFVLTLIYELVNDARFLESDQKSGVITLPVKIGPKMSLKITAVLFLIPIAMISYYMYTYFFSKSIIIGFILLFMVAPLLTAAILLLDKTDQKSIKKSLFLLKLVFVSIALSFVLYPYTIL